MVHFRGREFAYACVQIIVFLLLLSQFYDSISSFSCGLFTRRDVSGRNKWEA